MHASAALGHQPYTKSQAQAVAGLSAAKHLFQEPI